MCDGEDVVLTLSFGQSAVIGVNERQLKVLRTHRRQKHPSERPLTPSSTRLKRWRDFRDLRNNDCVYCS